MYATAACALLGLLPGARGADFIDRDWWSLRPLVRPELPEPADGDAARAHTPVDRFILAKLREMGLEMSPEADRRTLVRRLYFDLIGLPPTPEAVEAFVADTNPRAYEALVETLLASTAYGERWARHWLDVVHYADTHGYDKDQLRPNAWPYRDYVIRAFNEDRPYGRFIREQLAGDVLFPDSPDGVVATGFISAGPWDLIGHAEVAEEKIDGKIARHLDRDDMVMTTMNTFCSITIQCAQCHDHKRDPVTLEDYYRMQAVFSALDRADRSYDADPEVARERALLAQRKATLEARRSAIGTEIDALKPENVVAMEKEMAALGDKLKAATAVAEGERSGRYGYHSEVAANPATVKWVQVDLGAPTVIDDVLLFGADEYGFADFGFPERFRLEASNDADFASEVTVLADFTGADYPRPGSMPARFAGNGVIARHIRVTATRLWSRRHQGEPESADWIFALGELAVVSGGNLAPVAGVRALDTIEAAPRWGKANLVDGIYGARGLPAAESGSTNANDNDSAPDADVMRILALAGTELAELRAGLEALAVERDAALAAVVPDSIRDERGRVAEELTQVEAGLAALPKPSTVYAATIHSGSGNFKGTGGNGGRPRPIHVLARGDVRNPREEVGPGVPAAIIPGAPSFFALPDDHAESARRVALAEWVTRPDNPLTWRSIVNRVWLYHFGSAIVDSPNDFGRMGQLPSHPELLDWLAAEFRDGGQSIKQLHRLMVNSAAYRQASRGNPDAEAIDGGNRYLWRMNPRKLEAEALRDGMLAIAGKLDPTMYGPGFRDFVIEKPEHSPHYQYDKFDVDDASSHRRSVYRFIVRSQPQPFLNTLDCADPALLVDKRNETLTALQALALLNNAFVLRMAEHFAERLEGESPDPAARIARAYALALGRAPTADESEALGEYLSEHGLAATCRLILNLNEFTFVE